MDMIQKLTPDEMHRLSVEEFRESAKLPLTVVLDNVRSQHNIGSVFRTADAFRVEHIALCGICSTPPHREIHKTALGAEESVSWSHHASTEACVLELKERGYTVLAVELTHDSLKLGHDPIATDRPIALVLGNEVEGVQDEVLALCDGAVEIPQHGTKHSLNVSCAAAIVMWEMFQKLRIKNHTNMTKEERTERARALHRQGCNCCQAVVMAYADRLPIAPEHAQAAAAPFGRGLAGTREVCGCVSGMALVCGLTGHADDTRALVEKFRDEQGDIVCARLLAQGKRPCNEMVGDAAALLADII